MPKTQSPLPPAHLVAQFLKQCDNDGVAAIVIYATPDSHIHMQSNRAPDATQGVLSLFQGTSPPALEAATLALLQAAGAEAVAVEELQMWRERVLAALLAAREVTMKSLMPVAEPVAPPPIA